MRAVKLVFAWCFASAAAASDRMAAALVQTSANELPHTVRILLFATLSVSIACVFAMTWWSILRRKPSARGLGLAASVVPVLLGLVLIGRHPVPLFSLALIPLAFGLAGLGLFARTESARPAAAPPAPQPALPGDGTHALVSRFLPLVASGGAIEGSMRWSHFAAAHGLPAPHSLAIYAQFLAAVLMVLFLHEAGHALGGIALRMKLIGFVVGPFRWWMTDGVWTFEFRPATLLSFLGGTAVVPTEMDNFRRRKILQVAAGPLASLATGALAAALAFTAPGHFWAADWRVLSYFATLSFVVGLLNFVPFKMGNGYSDGAKLYQLRAEGLWADYHRLLGFIHSTKITPHRPRDYDIATVERAAGTIARGIDELHLHLHAYAYYLDNGQLAKAREALGRAERLCRESSLEPPADRYADFVFAIAFLRRDAATARLWWERMEARESYKFDDGLWNSRCALLLSENRLAEASELWKWADARARRLPKAGHWDAQRHAVQLLGHALKESRSATA